MPVTRQPTYQQIHLLLSMRHGLFCSLNKMPLPASYHPAGHSDQLVCPDVENNSHVLTRMCTAVLALLPQYLRMAGVGGGSQYGKK
jgi:hypothetical protein